MLQARDNSPVIAPLPNTRQKFGTCNRAQYNRRDSSVQDQNTRRWCNPCGIHDCDANCPCATSSRQLVPTDASSASATQKDISVETAQMTKRYGLSEDQAKTVRAVLKELPQESRSF